MSIQVLILIFNIFLFAGIAFYFASQRRQLQDEESNWLEKRKVLDQEITTQKTEIEIHSSEATNRSEFIITESESIANEIIEYLQKALGDRNAEAKLVLPSSDNYEFKLDQLRNDIKKQYIDRVERLLKRLEKFELFCT